MDSYSYLDDMISAGGLEASILETIAHRAGKIRGAMFESRALMQDFGMQAMGGMAGAWDLWEHVMLPYLLANCGSWIGFTKKVKKQLNEFQDKKKELIPHVTGSIP